MYPTIHSYNEQNFNLQGYGALADTIECTVSEELNGAFTLELTYPLNGLHSEYLTVGNIIVAKPNHNQTRQPFRISEVKKSFANNIQVYANHLCYDLSGYPIRSAHSYTSLASVISAMNDFTWFTGNVAYNQFTFGTDMTSAKSFAMDSIQTLRAWMGGQEGSIIDTYGGEWVYDDFNCFLTARRGQDTGYRISYGKNLAEYEKDKNYTEYSHVCAYWKKSEVVAYSDLVSTGISCAFRCGYIDASSAYEVQPTAAQLNSYASGQVGLMAFGSQTITVTPAQIGNDIIGLGDSVLICYETVFSTRVIKTVWDVLGGVYKTLQLGVKKANISDTIKSLSTAPNGSSGSSDVAVHTNTESMGLKRIGNIVELRFYGKHSSEVRAFTLPAEYRPAHTLSVPIVVTYNGRVFQGYMTISSGGVLSTYYYDYSGAGQVPDGSADIYGTHTYFLG